ncbi:hypothetical protein F5Y07DRAFT_355926 [Xylaria sp. FL0933]|nr:hypothetical protein F5Y07DRAFT_355926 [Xylaria sp. FL0933]
MKLTFFYSLALRLRSDSLMHMQCTVDPAATCNLSLAVDVEGYSYRDWASLCELVEFRLFKYLLLPQENSALVSSLHNFTIW